MNSSDLFLRTLKRIGYHDVDGLDDSELDSITSEKELESFFSVFSTLNEKNVLTTEEIEEYSTLTPAELAEIEILKENGQLQKNVEFEKKKEVLFLQEQLAHIENHNKSIERQLDLFKKHEEELLEEKEIQKNLLLNAKKRFQTYEMKKVPRAEEEYVSSLRSILEVAEDLEFLIVHSDDNKLPTSNFFKDIIQQYLDTEKKVLQCVDIYLQKNFQFQDNSLLFIAGEKLYKEELVKEASFLQKILKNSMIDKVLTEKEIQKIESMVKYLKTVKTSDFNCHPSQLRYELDDVLKRNEQLKKKEEELKTYAFDAGSKHVDALVAEMNLCATNETLNNFQFCVEKISLPMNTLMYQRARLEMVIASLSEHKQELQVIKDLIQRVLNQMKQEKFNLEERKVLFESKMTDAEQKENEPCPEATVLSSLYKILAVSEDFDTSKVSISEVVQKAKKLFEAEENCLKRSEEKMETLDLIEKHSRCLESLLNCVDEEHVNWHELEQELNVNLNNLVLKLTTLEGSITECSQDLEQKQKMLERKGNLRLARRLYVYALLNKELFKKCIDDIKIAIENSDCKS